MYFRFIGEGKSDPETIGLFGYEFTLHGDPVFVEDEHAIGKLTGSTHFEKVDGRTFVVAPNSDIPIADMKANQLRALAKERDITFPFGATKGAMIEALNNGD